MEPNRGVQNYYNNNVVSVGEWIVTFILLAIPVVNLILLLVWGFSDSTPLSKKNYAIAVLIIMVVGAVMGFLFGASVFSVFSNMS
jgi:Na+/melibiose symporter-like transporter